MATLALLIKSFRANVREGNPCTLTFTGDKIHLYPVDDKSPNANRTFIGVCDRPSTKPGFMARERNDMIMRSAELNS